MFIFLPLLNIELTQVAQSCLLKARACLSNVANAMAVDVLLTQGDRASIDTINISVLEQKLLSHRNLKKWQTFCKYFQMIIFL